MQKSGSYNQINEDIRLSHASRNIASEKRTPQNQHKPVHYTRSLSNNAIRTPQENRIRKTSTGSEQKHEPSLFFAGQGSVLSLVRSYEEQSNKNESDSKAERLKLERMNEIKNLKKQFEKEVNTPFQAHKELSTISERTEHSTSGNPPNLQTESPGVFINTNSKSAATSVTNPIRQLNDKFLDTSTGASGDNISVTNRNLSGLNSSTPVQMNNLNLSQNSSSKSKSTIQAIQNLKQERREIQIPIRYLNRNIDENDADEILSDSDDEDDQLIHVGPRKNVDFNRKFNEQSYNQTKTNYSSQEDFLSNTQVSFLDTLINNL